MEIGWKTLNLLEDLEIFGRHGFFWKTWILLEELDFVEDLSLQEDVDYLEDVDFLEDMDFWKTLRLLEDLRLPEDLEMLEDFDTGAIGNPGHWKHWKHRMLEILKTLYLGQWLLLLQILEALNIMTMHTERQTLEIVAIRDMLTSIPWNCLNTAGYG
ncbi:cerebellar degeneration-related antigen 1-like [Dipodomys spectabilis]|uniref:cerebellar degeneration-related antigen 1-like n=1 Tax=Dipodomys spectabilis TaxID=105255 RepID=UPI001C5384FD|nr:cerebellar degeneration-related antigen 1-like [Dipodomys spectabilis]